MSRIEPFDTLPDGRTVEQVTLQGGGLTANVLTYGATVQDLRLDGVDHPLVLGADRIAPYLGPMTYFGAIVGRYANRIAGGHFKADGRDWQADLNEGGRTTLHGGSEGTGQMLWSIAAFSDSSVTMVLDLPDGHMGFPGAMQVQVICSLSAEAALNFEITAEADRPTPCNFAHHGYFNLDGGPDILNHRLQIAAAHYLPVDADLIPTGKETHVEGTAFDFREPRVIAPGGYDHNFCLWRSRTDLRPVALLRGQSGLTMEVDTTEPGLQVYDGGGFGAMQGLGGRSYGRFAGVALETQNWPDAPNHPHFPDWLLKPGQTYRHRVSYRFSRASQGQ
ncbi:aldose epimerase family protein [Pseudooceanicola sp. LIPI14-2-Ac024]|uniref:aldose epimerase family protein n=1 Tax=Pseudooceanicola sp. LIPI14-2-Ac024 TaxID=3344875 RepID=UPI0035D09432